MCDCTFWDERGEGLNRRPVDPLADTVTIATNSNEHKLRGPGES